ncbi:hypothetical protein ACFVAV_17515 [Nocardia sp. NPDC057663]|uniref:hypothetical protein n=1 Tax=Nocardia sp. NPDC057663 TaxID=3346201 RepID=UPI00366D504D
MNAMPPPGAGALRQSLELTELREDGSRVFDCNGPRRDRRVVGVGWAGYAARCSA